MVYTALHSDALEDDPTSDDEEEIDEEEDYDDELPDDDDYMHDGDNNTAPTAGGKKGTGGSHGHKKVFTSTLWPTGGVRQRWITCVERAKTVGEGKY